jgi:glycosyltransferase involved in cell wall biosynthesis
MHVPFFSIIIPTLNEEGVLPHLLKDLDEQIDKDYDVWIVDGMSEDKTQKIVEKKSRESQHVHLLTTSKRNVSIQRNYGAKHAHGEWLIFFDADSRIRKTFISELKKQLTLYPCDSCNVYARADRPDLQSRLYVSMQNLLFESMARVGTPYAIGACFIVKKSVFTTLGGFNTTIAHMEDSELARRIHDGGYTFRMLSTPTFVYSLRRQRKEGTLKMVTSLFPYFLKSFIQGKYVTPSTIYPMHEGGTQFKDDKISL